MPIAVGNVLTKSSIVNCCADYNNKIVLWGFKIKGLSFDFSRLIICLFAGIGCTVAPEYALNRMSYYLFRLVNRIFA